MIAVLEFDKAFTQFIRDPHLRRTTVNNCKKMHSVSILVCIYLTFLILCLSSQTTEEGSTISCVIERMRGSLDHVYVNYSVTQLDNLDSETPANQDFINATGAVLFMPGQRSEVCVRMSQWLDVYKCDFLRGEEHLGSSRVPWRPHTEGRNNCDAPVVHCTSAPDCI